LHRFLAVFEFQSQLKNPVKDNPKLPVTASVTEIDIPRFQFACGKTRRGQGTNNPLGRPPE